MIWKNFYDCLFPYSLKICIQSENKIHGMWYKDVAEWDKMRLHVGTEPIFKQIQSMFFWGGVLTMSPF